MSEFDPSMLPPVGGVEVRAIGRGGRTVAAKAGAAERIAELWRRLPPGVQARCHLPPYEVRFMTGGEVVCSGTICWKCNNIHGVFGGERFTYEFDAGAPVSLDLLAEISHVAGAE